MNLLVTRPEPEASRTAARLRALRHSVIVQPLLTIVLNPPPPIAARPVAIAVTSQNGVRALASWPQAAAWRDVPLFSAGDMTRAAARAAGFTNVRASGPPASFADDVARDLGAVRGPVIYAAARDRAGTLAEDLGARGYAVEVIEAYRAEPVSALAPAVCDALAAGALDGALLYSRRTAATFRTLVEGAGLKEAVARITIFALSDAVGAEVAGLTGTVLVAARPDEDSLFRLLRAA
jgi:uroporphyrinogen-III synthase